MRIKDEVNSLIIHYYHDCALFVFQGEQWYSHIYQLFLVVIICQVEMILSCLFMPNVVIQGLYF